MSLHCPFGGWLSHPCSAAQPRALAEAGSEPSVGSVGDNVLAETLMGLGRAADIGDVLLQI